MFSGLVRRSDRCLVSSRSIAAQIKQDNVGVDLGNVAELRSGMKIITIFYCTHFFPTIYWTEPAALGCNFSPDSSNVLKSPVSSQWSLVVQSSKNTSAKSYGLTISHLNFDSHEFMNTVGAYYYFLSLYFQIRLQKATDPCEADPWNNTRNLVH